MRLPVSMPWRLKLRRTPSIGHSQRIEAVDPLAHPAPPRWRVLVADQLLEVRAAGHVDRQDGLAAALGVELDLGDVRLYRREILSHQHVLEVAGGHGRLLV